MAKKGVDDLIKRVKDSRLPPAQERRDVREAAGCSLRDVGSAIGVSPMTVCRWEEGDTPKLEHAVAYRRLLDGLREVTANGGDGNG